LNLLNTSKKTTMKKLISCFTLFLLVMSHLNAQEVIRLYNSQPAAGNAVEKITYSPSGEILSISNVTDPSITVYLPDPEIATGTAVVLCPGGGMRMLGWNNDVIKMSKFLNEKGIAAIGLKYRLQNSAQPAQSATPNAAAPAGPGFSYSVIDFAKWVNANANPSRTEESYEAVRLAAADAQQAIKIIREHAAEWHIKPDKIGYLGFSAGGGVAIAAVVRSTNSESMPDFLATAYGPSLIDVSVPANAPPLFICTNSDHVNVAAGCLALFLEWKKAGFPAELHIYGTGKGGFSIDAQGQTSDTWSNSFMTWLTAEGF
jgi:dienelactone hydrolase